MSRTEFSFLFPTVWYHLRSFIYTSFKRAPSNVTFHSYRLTLGDRTDSPSPPPCSHSKNPVTGHCKHCLIATRNSLCVQSNPCHKHASEPDTFWAKVAKHASKLENRRAHEKQKRLDNKKPKPHKPIVRKMPKLPLEVVHIDVPDSPDEEAAPDHDAHSSDRDDFTEELVPQPVPPPSPTASVSPLDSEDEAEGHQDADGGSQEARSDSTVSPSVAQHQTTVLP